MEKLDLASERNVYSEAGFVSREEREHILQQRGFTIWFTGLSASGKTTLARILERELFSFGCLTYVLDGDNIRHGLNSDLGFDSEDRKENIRRVAEVAKLMNSAGIIVIVSLISPFREDRQRARNIIGECRFAEVYLKCSLETCEKRDPKGLYKKARSGEIKNFTGIQSPYEVPVSPDFTANSDSETPDESAEKLINQLMLNSRILFYEEGRRIKKRIIGAF